MDQHPIPQDVTGFQFKLIGNMTVKQFGYVAAGVIGAVLLYYMPLNFPLAILFKLLFVPLFGGGGAIVAFIPIEGRPIDVMAGNFMKAMVSPNQFVYIKKGRKLTFLDVQTHGATQTSNTSNTLLEAKQKKTEHLASNKERQLDEILHRTQRKPQNKLDEKEGAYLKLFNTPTAAPQQSAQVPKPIVHTQPTVPITQPVHPVQNMIPPVMPQPVTNQNSQVQDETNISQLLAAARQEETMQHTPQSVALVHQKVLTLEKQLIEAHMKKSQLEEEVLKLRSQLQVQTAQPAPVQIPQGHPTAQVTNKANMPYIPDTPNVLVGIVRDPRGNMLPSILVEVKDKNGNPVRAFKTNALGQFASATPLAPGIYSMQLEDPKKQHIFEIIQISVTNQIMMPIEITSHDAREELRRQLFN